jgi:predicted RNA-binding Zn-ribbon protein involved in translation (DUF1610 family)
MKTENPGCLSAIMRMFGIRSKSSYSVQSVESDDDFEQIPYNLRDDFLSNAEASFYHVIQGMMGDYFTICPKISLGNLFYVSRKNEQYQAYLNKIDRKHVDFLICEPKTMKPRFGIELDDTSHQRSDRVERDLFVDKVFEAAGLPLVRVQVKNGYDTRELGLHFKAALEVNHSEQTKTMPGSAPSPKQDEAPFCPQCGERMVLREARRGAKAGTKFYGCPNYPQCKTILPVG